MARFYASTDTLVTDVIDGVLAAAPPGTLARLDGYPSIKVVIRDDWSADRVAVISGGGSGHEPAHAGFVGAGMLTAAVCGEVFASPSVDAVFAAIMAVSGPAGCLLVVKNYTGDRLNFGLAAEKARAKGIPVETVLVSDDVATAHLGHPRGIAGTLFVHKLAGYLAEKGESLETIAAAARGLAGRLATMGVSLTTCRIPGNAFEERIADGHMEVGLGIHGEPGIGQKPIASGTDIAAELWARLTADGRIQAGKSYVALVNTLGGVAPYEASAILKALTAAPAFKHVSHIVGPAALMTSLDMRGVSLTIVEADPATVEAFAAPTAVRTWPGLVTVAPAVVRPVPDAVAGTAFHPSDDPVARKLIAAGAAALVAARGALNALDAKVGDGDTGTTFANAASAIDAALGRLPLADRSALFLALSDILSKTAGGSSGVLLSLLSAGIGNALKGGRPIQEAFVHGLTVLQNCGGAAEGQRTMMDAFWPAARVIASGGSLTAAAEAAQSGAEATAHMLEGRAGRSSYVQEASLSGISDPGATAIAILFAALAEAGTA